MIFISCCLNSLNGEYMNIEGNKILLRAIEEKDNGILQELINDPDIENMVCGHSFPVSQRFQNKWFDEESASPNTIRCAIETINDNKTVGTIILSNIDYINGNAEIHIKILTSFHHCGIGKEAVDLLVEYAFNYLRLHLVYAEILDYNNASKALFKKCRFEYNGTLKNRIFKNKGILLDIRLENL